MKRHLELPGRILMTWFAAGAVLTGGFLVAYGLFTERVAFYGLLYMVGGLYILGGLLGLVFGGAVGMFGRPGDMSRKEALEDQLLGSVYGVLLASVGLVAAGWIGLTYWAAYSANPFTILMVTLAWLVGAWIVALAAEYGWFGLRNLRRHVPTIRIYVEWSGHVGHTPLPSTGAE